MSGYRREALRSAMPYLAMAALLALWELACIVVDVPEKNLGGVMELVGNRKGELVRMDNRAGQVHLEFTIPARGLIGSRLKGQPNCAMKPLMTR